MKCVNTDEELKQIQMELKLHSEVMKSDREPLEKKLKATEAALKLVKREKQKQLAAYQEFARTGEYPVGLLKDKDITDPLITNRRIERLKAEIEHMDSQIDALDYTKTIAEETKKQIAAAERLSELFSKLDSETYVEEGTGVTGKKHGPESEAVTKINDEIARLEKAHAEKFAEQIKLKRVKDEQIKIAVRIAELRGGIVEAGGKEVTAPTREMATELQKLADLQQEEKAIRESMKRRTSYEEELVKEENKLRESAKNRLAKLLTERDTLARGEKPEVKGKKADVAPRDRAAIDAEIKEVRQEIKDLKESAVTQDERDLKDLQKQIDSLDGKILRMTQGTEKKPRGAKQMAYKEELMPLVEERNAKAEQLSKLQEAARPKKEPKPLKPAEQKRLDSLKKQRDSKEQRLAELQSEQKKPKGKDQAVLNEEQMAVKNDIDELDKQIKQYEEAASGKEAQDPYQRAMERRMKYRDNLQKRIKEGPKPSKGKLEGPYSEDRAKLEEEIAQLMADQKDTEWFKEKSQESALRRWKTSQLKSIASMKKQIEENDFSTPVNQKRQIELDVEAERIMAEKKDMENQYRKAKERAEYEAKTPMQRALDTINAFKRFSILSGPVGIFKLTSASLGVLQNRALTESIGYGFSKIPLVKEIMKKDPFSSTYERQKVSRDMSLYVKGLIKGGKEFANIVRGRGSELSKKFGEDSGIPPNWLGFFGRLHEAIKYPTLRANYDMGYSRYLDWAERHGMNPESPEVINQAELEAFKYANESIFKEDNWLVRKYQNLTQEARNSSSPMRRALGFGLEQTLPIVKIPSNIVKQTFEHVFGSAPATYKLIKAAIKGTENMTSEEAHIMMRQMKRGSTGLLMMTIGVLLKDYIGGVYIKGEDESEEVPYGSIRAGNFTIPKYLMENPLFACLQVGATAARFWENHYGEDDGFLGNAKLAARAAALTSIGVVEEAPFVSAILNTDKALRGTQSLDTTLSEIYARPYVPAALQYVANIQDLDDGIDLKNKPLMENFSTLMNRRSTKRTPSDWFEAIELGIPFLRQEVTPR